jgi:hypothetical protein
MSTPEAATADEHEEFLPRSKAERVHAQEQRAVSEACAAAVAAAAAAALPASRASHDIAAAGGENALARQLRLREAKQAARTSSAALPPVRNWLCGVSCDRRRRLLSVPVSRLLSLPSVMGLLGEMGNRPEGIVALFLAGMWLYAQAVPPKQAQHAATGLTDARRLTARASQAEQEPLQQQQQQKPMAVEPVQRRRGAAVLGPTLTAASPPSNVTGAPLLPLGLGGGVDLADMADAILTLLLDESLTETKDRSPRRYFRSSDRVLLDKLLRGKPDVVQRFAAGANERVAAQAHQLRQEKQRARAARRATARASQEALRLDATVGADAAAPDEDEDETTFNVTLKGDDEDDASEQECSEDDADGNGASFSSTGDSLDFLIEENALSATFVLPSVAGGSPSAAQQLEAARNTTRFVSADGFRTHLLPVRLKQDAAGLWRVHNFYGLLAKQPAATPASLVHKES